MNNIGDDCAFPVVEIRDGCAYVTYWGLTKREYFAIRAPEPTAEQMQHQVSMDTASNPNGDSYKPKRRSMLEIEADLRYAWADEMLNTHPSRT